MKINIIFTEHAPLSPFRCTWSASYFGKTVSDARSNYVEYVKSGFNQGRRPELTGGGLIKSLGGWRALKKIRLKGQDRVKSDARILGDSDFVTQILEEANEKLDRHYELKSRGYDLAKVEQNMKYKLIE